MHSNMTLFRRAAAGAILARTNLSIFERPDRLPRALAAVAPWGPTVAGAVAAAAARYPERVAIVDDDGRTTYRTLWRDARRVAAGLSARGVGPDTRVGLLCRNHLGFVEWLVAVLATGADVVLLNTGFAGPQLTDVVEQEDIGVVIHDDEFGGALAGCGAETFDEAAMRSLRDATTRVTPRRDQGQMVILTSGTTGRPKGAARRSDPAAIEGVAAVLARVPLRLGDTQVIAAPLFHGWGLANLLLGLGRCATNVLARRFDAEATLLATAGHAAEVLVVVPVMLSRILALPPEVLVSAPTPHLRVIASSGSALGSKLASGVLDRFGPVLYNLYGSTEVAVATIATPADLLAAPSTAGRVAFGVRVEILDERGNPVLKGAVGRVFVGGPMRFDGYTSGGGKEEHRGLLSSGDLGYFRDGLLFVEGREDDMIVSGGENVFPGEVEELLRHHPAIADAAVIGVPEDEFGQALAAFVVVRDGASLTVDEVRAHVRDHLARHKVPRRVDFLDELPRNPTGKLLRGALAASCEPDVQVAS
jgi:acyl-CoA synthetase (AMP-forming)/AMP-acid ligase II